jgi:phosphoglycerate dehydrogenase-like enzyme
MKVVFYQKLNSLWKQKFEPVFSEFPDVQFVTNLEEAKGQLADADVLVGGKPDRAAIEAAAKLAYIVVPFAGVNHLPLDLIHERGIRVSNSHGNAYFVAERTAAMILAYYGKIIEYHNDMRERAQWHGFWVGRGLDDTWESVYGKSCVILGAGEIGKATAALLKPFGIRMTGYKRRPVDTPVEGFDEMVYEVDEALEKGEIIVIALPATEETKALIDRRRLSAMKGKFLVNVGRGSIVEEKALYEALESGLLKGAAIDCWYRYPEEGTVGEPSAYPIHRLDNVVLSPHAAGFTRQSTEKNIEHAALNLAGYLREGRPLFEAHTDAGY